MDMLDKIVAFTSSIKNHVMIHGYNAEVKVNISKNSDTIMCGFSIYSCENRFKATMTYALSFSELYHCRDFDEWLKVNVKKVTDALDELGD